MRLFPPRGDPPLSRFPSSLTRDSIRFSHGSRADCERRRKAGRKKNSPLRHRSRFIPIPCCKSYEIVSRDKKRKKKKRKKDRKRIALQLPRSAKTRKKPRLGKKRRAPRFDFVVARREINHREIKVGHGFTADIFRGNAVFLSRVWNQDYGGI